MSEQNNLGICIHGELDGMLSPVAVLKNRDGSEFQATNPTSEVYLLHSYCVYILPLTMFFPLQLANKLKEQN